MSERCLEQQQKADCGHLCDRITEMVQGKSGTIYGRCLGCGHTVEVGYSEMHVTTLGPRVRPRYYLGVSSYYDGETGRLYLRFDGGAGE